MPKMEKEMVTDSSIVIWKIPWTEEPGRLQSMGSQRVEHDLATKEQQRPRGKKKKKTRKRKKRRKKGKRKGGRKKERKEKIFNLCEFTTFPKEKKE